MGLRRASGRWGALAALGAVVWMMAAGAPSAEGGPQPYGDFRGLPEYVSRGGSLNVTLVAAPKQVTVDGVRLNALTFNGEYAGPVLRLKPGDRLKIHLVNHTRLPINLHFHGSYASPRAEGDNVHIVVGPGTSFDYRLTLPRSLGRGRFSCGCGPPLPAASSRRRSGACRSG
jgi:FtsP/CotA-like multicopper oxidase with cupredoxin domain